VLNGRDITHNIVPDATFKFYVTASILKRSQRRYKELKKLGKKDTLKEIFKSLKKRDKSDKSRGKREGKLIKTKDSWLINNTHLSITECFLKVKKIIDRRLNNYDGRNHKIRKK
jgi:cytidylate kinase